MLRSCVLLLTLNLNSLAALHAQDASSEEPAANKHVGYDDLARLGNIVREPDFASYNPYLAATKTDAARRAAALLEGREIRFQVEVDRVTKTEVYLRVYDAGRTRVLLQFADGAGNPYFGNQTTRMFQGPPSVSRINRLAGPPALRIGAGIDLELARQLDRHDVLVMSGRVVAIEVRIQSGYTPQSLAILGDLRVVRRQVGDATQNGATQNGDVSSESDAEPSEVEEVVPRP